MSDQTRGLETRQGQTNHTAVVVEDDQIVVTLLEHLLARRGFDVRIARDGRQAIDFMNTLPSPPALVLLDVMLPHLDGFELIKKIREHARWNLVHCPRAGPWRQRLPGKAISTGRVAGAHSPRDKAP